MAKIGKVLWWDKRDQEGILIDSIGNQFYFNKSVLDAKVALQLKDGALVEFQPSDAVPEVPCAENVRILSAKKQKSAERQFSDVRVRDLEGGI